MARSRAAWLRCDNPTTGGLRGRTLRDTLVLDLGLFLAVGELCRAACRFRFCAMTQPALPLLS
jgi:hypothetical protein